MTLQSAIASTVTVIAGILLVTKSNGGEYHPLHPQSQGVGIHLDLWSR